MLAAFGLFDFGAWGEIIQGFLIKTLKNRLLRLKPLGYAAGLNAEPASLYIISARARP